jgi:DNA-nicking Smr family endonuclease
MGAKKNREPENFSFHPFEGLKEIIEGRGVEVASGRLAEKKPAPPTDEELFEKAMTGVTEIKEYRRLRTGGKKITSPLRKDVPDCDALQALKEIVAGRRAINLADTQEYVEWINDDVRGDFTRLLHEGRFSVKDCLDLHGLTVDEAEEAVALFFRESLRKGYKCLKIIHGRGLRSPHGPVLKGTLIKRLSGHYRKNVIAFVSARQCDGGLGALYVLLK